MKALKLCVQNQKLQVLRIAVVNKLPSASVFNCANQSQVPWPLNPCSVIHEAPQAP